MQQACGKLLFEVFYELLPCQAAWYTFQVWCSSHLFMKFLTQLHIKPACKSSLQCWASISVSLAPLASHSTDWARLACSRMDTKKLKSTVKMWYMSVDDPVKIQSWTSYHQPASWGYAVHSLQLHTMYCSSFKFSFFKESISLFKLSASALNWPFLVHISICSLSLGVQTVGVFDTSCRALILSHTGQFYALHSVFASSFHTNYYRDGT